MTEMIDGKKIAAQTEDRIQNAISRISGRKPGLAVILVGQNPS
ncbi:MAG: bifunctional 5,10-methylene-tetrahydrofolate dehydrogenase/5,10-methylene-tetrahydrofolate cyclohydrolase, partial [Chlamydiae bacterium]|nr:bifunctional 5,10-methylene-tetrahydrofolate dehydrogenase/5,10-methylene-tetrahydrofolate cyclohydrolase [Chlamydiota bacterium]